MTKTRSKTDPCHINFFIFFAPFSCLSRVSILTRDIDTANLSVRLSVRYVPVPDENGLTYRHSFFHRTPNHSSFIIIKYLHEIPTGSPPAGALNTGGVYKFRDFRPVSRYISQTIQDIAVVTMVGE